jgi:hypothetical protein
VALATGTKAPPIFGVDLDHAPKVLFFFKVTCPVCQMAAPKVATFDRAYPGRFVAIGQDPPPKLVSFSKEFDLPGKLRDDPPPYPASRAYGIRVVPTTFLVGEDGMILDAVESWDRDRLNDLSRQLAELTGATYAPISDPSDGLPVFRPG